MLCFPAQITWLEVMRIIHRRTTICPKCYAKREQLNKAYCNACTKQYYKAWRKRTPYTEQQKYKNRTRLRTWQLVQRGIIAKQPCAICKASEVQAHHADYDDPYNVTWLCMTCHRQHHVTEQYGVCEQLCLAI
jgi:hypothetical protein